MTTASAKLILTIPLELERAIKRAAKKAKRSQQHEILAILCREYDLPDVRLARGRPRTRPPVDPAAPKRKRGRPVKAATEKSTP